MKADYACRICGATDSTRTYTMRETMFGLADRFAYFQCGQCGCLQIARIPPEMDRYYPAGYYSFGASPRDQQTGRRAMRRLRAMRNYYSVFPKGPLGWIVSSLFPNKKLAVLAAVPLLLNASILDVGCGAGWRLYALREAGFLNTLGIDPFLGQDELVHDNGLRILRKALFEMAGTWDLIMFHHSFEHMPDPLAALQKAASLLDPNGTCLMRLPLVDSFAWEHYQNAWYQIDAPRHYYLHSRKSIDLLARSSGLAVHRDMFDSTLDQFRKSEQLLAEEDRQPSSGSWQKLRWKRETKRLNREGRGDQAVFYLRKQ